MLLHADVVAPTGGEIDVMNTGRAEYLVVDDPFLQPGHLQQSRLRIGGSPEGRDLQPQEPRDVIHSGIDRHSVVLQKSF